MHRDRGRLIDAVSDEELIALLQRKLANDRFPELPKLLIDPYIVIARTYRAPMDMFEKMETIVATPQVTVDGKVYDVPAGIDWNRDSGISTLQLHKDYSGSLERLTDIGIHEIGHVLGNYKAYLYWNNLDNDQAIMPNVPQSHCRGMDEGFAELMRMRFSSFERFPCLQTEADYIPPILGSLSSILASILAGGTSVSKMLTSDDQVIANQIVPSILYHAQEQGKYDDLIKNYNAFIRTANTNPIDEKLFWQIEGSINNTFPIA